LATTGYFPTFWRDPSATLAFITNVKGTVNFGDSSVIDIFGRGTVLFSWRLLTGVYFIPRLRSHIVSLGQLDEHGCKIGIEHAFLTINDRPCRLLVKVKQSANCLYILTATLGSP
jgi:hypothetical protein